MERTGVQRLAAALKVLVNITFVCNLVALLLVPGMSLMKGADGLLPLILHGDPLGFFAASWGRVWSAGIYETVLALFLLFCGVCTAVVLWQSRQVLGTVLEGNPFQMVNSRSLRCSAVSSFLISAAALVRLIWGLAYYQSAAPLLTYNALFIPVFFMAGLLCLVMSALFRQAAELKAENDLTI